MAKIQKSQDELAGENMKKVLAELEHLKKSHSENANELRKLSAENKKLRASNKPEQQIPVETLIEHGQTRVKNLGFRCDVNPKNASQVNEICRRVEHRELKPFMAQEMLSELSK